MSIRTPANACTCIAFPSARKRSTTPRWSSTSMVREWRPLERELSSLKLARRSTMRTSVPASVSSAASIIPVGPPPAITTACSDIHHSSLPNVCRETLHHARGLAASPRGGATLRWREWDLYEGSPGPSGRGDDEAAPLHLAVAVATAHLARVQV